MEQGTASGGISGFNVGTDPNWRSRLSVEDRQRMINNIYHAVFPIAVFTEDVQFQAGRLEYELFCSSTSMNDYVNHVANFIQFMHNRRMMYYQFNCETVDLAIPSYSPPPPPDYGPLLRPRL